MTSIQVEPDSQGNITITIKLVIAGAGAGAGAGETNTEIVTAIEREVNESFQSENLLQSDSDSSTVINETTNEDENNDRSETMARQYSLRSRIRINNASTANNDDSGEDYEVDNELSQQVSSFLRF